MKKRLNNILKYNKIICLNCDRELINSSYLTEEGCLWCDEKYWRKHKNEIKSHNIKKS